MHIKFCMHHVKTCKTSSMQARLGVTFGKPDLDFDSLQTFVIRGFLKKFWSKIKKMSQNKPVAKHKVFMKSFKLENLE